MNAHFAGSGINFALAGVTRHMQPVWYTSATQNSQWATAMKTALYTGNRGTLNVYSIGMQDLAGYATWPWDYWQNPKMDGVVIRHTTMPGGRE